MRELPVRKNIRLRNYDYSQTGYYFITICTQNRINRFGEISRVGQGLCSCRLTDIGVIVEAELLRLENRYNDLRVEKHVVMPNHIHAIIALDQRREQSPRPTALADAVCAFKSITAKLFNKMNDTKGRTLWQSRYHDHIIRDDTEYRQIWEYIDNNPSSWHEDNYFYTENTRVDSHSQSSNNTKTQQ